MQINVLVFIIHRFTLYQVMNLDNNEDDASEMTMMHNNNLNLKGAKRGQKGLNNNNSWTSHSRYKMILTFVRGGS